MAKTSQINRNKKREKMVAQYAARRAALKAKTEDMSVAAGRALRGAPQARQAAAQFVEDAHPSPLRAGGPAKGYYRKVKLSRIALRQLANFGQVPGMTKASW